MYGQHRKAKGEPSEPKEVTDAKAAEARHWSYYCFQYYSDYLVRLSMDTILSDGARWVFSHEGTDPRLPRLSVLTSSLLREEAKRNTPEANPEYGIAAQVAFSCYWELSALGSELVSDGVSLTALVKLLGAAQRLHWLQFRDLIRLLSDDEMMRARLLTHLKTTKSQEYKRAEHRARELLRVMSEPTDSEKLSAVSSGRLLSFDSYWTSWIAHTILTQSPPAKMSSRLDQFMKSSRRFIVDQLVPGIIALLERHGIKGRYQKAARLMNLLLIRFEYDTVRDPGSHKSRGEERIKKQYARRYVSRSRRSRTRPGRAAGTRRKSGPRRSS